MDKCHVTSPSHEEGVTQDDKSLFVYSNHVRTMLGTDSLNFESCKCKLKTSLCVKAGGERDLLYTEVKNGTSGTPTTLVNGLMSILKTPRKCTAQGLEDSGGGG